MKFVITEEEKKEIKLLYEQTNPNDYYWVGKKRYFEFDNKWRVTIEIFNKKSGERVAGSRIETENTDLNSAYNEKVKEIQKDLLDKNIKGVKIPTVQELETHKDEEYLSELKGKTFNTYDDPQNLSFYQKYTIQEIKKSDNWGTLTITLAGSDYLAFFRCGTNHLEFHNYLGKESSKKIYSNKLVQYIKTKYCTNKGGSPKPKSDFIP